MSRFSRGDVISKETLDYAEFVVLSYVEDDMYKVIDNQYYTHIISDIGLSLIKRCGRVGDAINYLEDRQ